MSRPLLDEERERFEAIRNADNIVLIQTEFEGQDVATICALTEDEDEVLMWPLALLLPDWLHERLRGPEGEVLAE